MSKGGLILGYLAIVCFSAQAQTDSNSEIDYLSFHEGYFELRQGGITTLIERKDGYQIEKCKDEGTNIKYELSWTDSVSYSLNLIHAKKKGDKLYAPPKEKMGKIIDVTENFLTELVSYIKVDSESGESREITVQQFIEKMN